MSKRLAQSSELIAQSTGKDKDKTDKEKAEWRFMLLSFFYSKLPLCAILLAAAAATAPTRSSRNV